MARQPSLRPSVSCFWHGSSSLFRQEPLPETGSSLRTGCNDPRCPRHQLPEPTPAIVAAARGPATVHVGHAEPTTLFFSTAGASGNNMQWKFKASGCRTCVTNTEREQRRKLRVVFHLLAGTGALRPELQSVRPVHRHERSEQSEHCWSCVPGTAVLSSGTQLLEHAVVREAAYQHAAEHQHVPAEPAAWSQPLRPTSPRMACRAAPASHVERRHHRGHDSRYRERSPKPT